MTAFHLKYWQATEGWAAHEELLRMKCGMGGSEICRHNCRIQLLQSISMKTEGKNNVCSTEVNTVGTVELQVSLSFYVLCEQYCHKITTVHVFNEK
jgi:hypothetical protein